MYKSMGLTYEPSEPEIRAFRTLNTSPPNPDEDAALASEKSFDPDTEGTNPTVQGNLARKKQTPPLGPP